MARVGIVGGPGGLALAHDLSRRHDVTLFEAADDLGGLARSVAFGDIRIESYYHFICGPDAGYARKLGELGLEDRLRWTPTGMGFFLHGTLYPMTTALDLLRVDQLPVTGRLRYGLHALYCSLRRSWRGLDRIAAERWLRRWLGPATYQATWFPLLDGKFDESRAAISAAWVWHRIHRVARSRRTPLHRERLGHLAGGTEVLFEAIVRECRARGVAFHPGTSVERIVVAGGRAVGLRTADGRQWPFDRVVSAVPLPLFLRMTPDLPEDYRERLAGIRFIGVVCVVLRLRESFSEYFWLNINDARVPYSGVIEYTRLNPAMTPDGSTILYVPLYLPASHLRFGWSDAQLVDECVAALPVVNPRFDRSWVIDAMVGRDRHAQVVCPAGFGERVPPHATPVDGLYLIESSQLFPSDRTISGTIDLAREVATLIDGRER